MKNASTKKVRHLEEPELSPGFLLWKVSSKWRWLVETKLEKIGLTYQQFILLISLVHTTKGNAGITQIKLAQHCETDVTMTSQVLRSLERKGYIKRYQRKDDARSKFSQVTKQGESIIQQAIPIVEAVDKQFFEVLGAELKKYIIMQQKLRRKD